MLQTSKKVIYKGVEVIVNYFYDYEYAQKGFLRFKINGLSFKYSDPYVDHGMVTEEYLNRMFANLLTKYERLLKESHPITDKYHERIKAKYQAIKDLN